MSDPRLEHLRRTIPAARCLPLLECLALSRANTAHTGTVIMDYLRDLRLRLTVS